MRAKVPEDAGAMGKGREPVVTLPRHRFNDFPETTASDLLRIGC
jgi:hypothetical protein